MKNSSRTHTAAAPQSMFRLNPVAAGAALLLMAMGGAHAQTAPSTQPADAAPAPAAAASAGTQTVTVTGIRRGIESAISVKQNADGVVEALSAEDIGKLPDTTIAESLARLPGVTAQRDRNGNATNISIRGLGPDFNGYLLNGREQTSTGDSRAVDLSVYPAELIGAATVYKTSDATLMTAGLAGTIDNRLIDPLAFPNRVIAANVEKNKTGVGLPVTGTGHRYSLSYIDQFADRKVGVALGYVHSEGTSNSLSQGSWGSTVPVTLANGTSAGKLSIPFAGGLTFESDRNTDKRDGVAAILTYKPNKDFTSELDLYYAKIKTALKKIEAQGGTNGGAVTNAVVAGGVVQSGTFQLAAGPNGLIDRSENLFDDDQIESLGWKNSLKFSDGWSGSVDLNHNKATRVERDIEAYAGITTADTLSFTNGGGTIPQFTLGNAAAYTNPATIAIRDQSGWSGVSYPSGPYAGKTVPQAGYSKGPTVTDKLDAIRFDFKRDLKDSMFTDVQFGANFSKRSKDRVTDEGVIISATNGGYDRIPFPGGAYVASNVGGTGLNLLTFDPQAGLWPGAVILPKFNDDILSKTWTIDEKVTTGYAKLDIDTAYANVPIRGNVGAQIVNTNQSSAGFRADVSSSVTLTNPANGLSTNGTTYTDFLPSLNLAADFGAGNVLRFGLSQQIARPTLTDMRNSFAASVDNNTGDAAYGHFVGSAGNPYLQPFKAKALDLSYEKYFGNKGYLGAAGFYKKLDTYIAQQTNVGYDFTTYASELGLAIPAAGPLGIFTSPVNGHGGNMGGVELTASIPFNMLTSVLNGFGFTSSYSWTTSSVNLPNLIGLNPAQKVPTSGSIPLPGLSRDNAKLMLYYEAGGFSAFVADNYRSTYVGSVANTTIGGYPSLVFIQNQTWVSAQIGYEFQEGRFKGLGFRFEGNNLNRPVYRELNYDGSVNNSNQTGATLAFKLSYKLQ